MASRPEHKERKQAFRVNKAFQTELAPSQTQAKTHTGLIGEVKFCGISLLYLHNKNVQPVSPEP